jgi:hypothetical protein
VEKEDFLNLAKNYTSLTVEESLTVDELQQTYPYCQVIHCLATRGARDNQLEKSNLLLALSAVYATDRSVLKAIMTSPRVDRGNSAQAQLAKPQVMVAAELAPAGPELSGEALNEEIMMDLERLQQLKQDFEASFAAYSKSNPATRSTSETKARALPPAEKPAASAKETPTPGRKAKQNDELIPEPSGEAILAEIASTRKRVAPGTEKQKEQIQIIDQFISKQPSIKRNPTPPGDAPDLTERGADLIDSMVSETLVEILLRQGKKDKAIEVLRKLIWKFPQKKAIFAAQIDELKK